jgi:ferredoxin
MSTRVRFEPSGFETEIDAPVALVDVTDEHPDADVPYSCRSASCGTCRVEVVAGSGALLPPEEDELEVLEIFGDSGPVRLCCQLQLARDTEQLTLRVVDPY